MSLMWSDSTFLEWAGNLVNWSPLTYVYYVPTVRVEEQSHVGSIVFGGKINAVSMDIEEKVDITAVLSFYRNKVCGVKSSNFQKIGGISGYYIIKVNCAYGGI